MVTPLILFNDVFALAALPALLMFLPELIIVLKELDLEILTFPIMLDVTA